MASPYTAAASDYLEAGWSPIPLPYKEKDPPPNKPVSFTGADGVYVTEEQLRAWLKPKARCSAGNLSYPPGNIALRLPRTVIGIDVDAYGTKRGAETLEAAEEAWGALPTTWVSGSREDGISGIRLYRIPEGLAWPGQLPQGGGVELLRWDHRFAIVAPSLHPEGRKYRWFRETIGESGEVELAEVEDEIPAPDDLPELPPEWIDGLTGGAKWKERALDEEMGQRELQEWLSARTAPEVLCRAMRTTVTKYTREIRQAGDDGGAHDAARDGGWAVLGDARSGHSGVVKALTELRTVFLRAVEGRRADPGAAKSEWARIVQRGAAKVSAEGKPEAEDPCSSNKAAKSRGSGSGPLNWRMDDVGNAERLIRVMDDRARWVEALGLWMLWDESRGLWSPDSGRQIDRWAVKAVNSMQQEAEYLSQENEKKYTEFRRFAKSSGKVGPLKAMVEVARGRLGIGIPAEAFDSQPELLGVGNGVVELRPEGVALRVGVREDYLTLATPVRYVEDVAAGLWSTFLKRVQPDQEVREWLQRLVGYSLLGHNAASLLVALVGPTSTGKTTFAEAIRVTLGAHAGPMPASVFRDNADDKPRPDLLNAMPKRVVIAEELSAAQHLHADQIKRITGGSVIAARGMRSDTYIHRIPAFTPWIVSNSAPTVNGSDMALWRRILVVPFEVQIPLDESRPDFARALRSEANEEILSWAIRGYEMFADETRRGNSLFDMPVGVLETNAAFREQMSDLDLFVSECCETAEEYHENRTRLYDAYAIWCDREGIPRGRGRLSGPQFGKEMSGKGFPVKHVRIEGNPKHVRSGLRLSSIWRKHVGDEA
jgi:putative DNA primase/helicase